MTLLQEATLDRLWSRYQNRFGHQPPIQSASLDQAIALLRRELAGGGTAGDDDDDGGPRPGGMAAGIPAAFTARQHPGSPPAMAGTCPP